MMDTLGDMEAVLGHEVTYSLDFQGYHLVFLSPEVRPELGIRRGGCYKAQYLGDSTIRWLKKDLAENKLPALVFTNYPLAEDETEEDPLMFMKDRAQVKEILKNDPNVLAVFSGHQHVAKEIKEDGVSYFLVGAMVPAPKDDGVVSGEYMQVALKGREITVSNERITLAELDR